MEGGSVGKGLFPGPEPAAGLDEESLGRSRLLGADRVLSGVASAGKLSLVCVEVQHECDQENNCQQE